MTAYYLSRAMDFGLGHDVENYLWLMEEFSRDFVSMPMLVNAGDLFSGNGQSCPVLTRSWTWAITGRRRVSFLASPVYQMGVRWANRGLSILIKSIVRTKGGFDVFRVDSTQELMYRYQYQSSGPISRVLNIRG